MSIKHYLLGYWDLWPALPPAGHKPPNASATLRWTNWTHRYVGRLSGQPRQPTPGGGPRCASSPDAAPFTIDVVRLASETGACLLPRAA